MAHPVPVYMEVTPLPREFLAYNTHLIPFTANEQARFHLIMF